MGGRARLYLRVRMLSAVFGFSPAGLQKPPERISLKPSSASGLSEFGNISLKGGKIFREYLDLQESYLSHLISDPLAAFVKERMTEADNLQRINDQNIFYQKFRRAQPELGRL
jgi:hypothetical protein